ncbi:FRG domain-containing protein [Roseateles sp. DXS20W]|uniref:FRG domain-containing protein n=1 Tax=Pelomonas lactea TaxID=3299030 RepID=A0ABW7GG35_9BURK
MTDAEMPPSETISSESSDYFEKIPLWTNESAAKRFEIMADELSGRIPVTRLKSWRDFTALLESDFFNRSDAQLVFRGHRRFDWGLMPTLARLTTNGIVTEALATAQLDRFKRAVRGRLSDAAMVDEDDELWSVGQHHGLMTPLLDWTYSPYVALFFAFHKEDSKDEQKDNPYRAVYVLNKRFLAEHEAETGIRVCEPRKDDHGRLVNQAGLFTFSPTDATIENKLASVLADDQLFEDEELRSASEDEQPGILAKYICKIYIRNEERDACLRHLRRMNVHHASLFPDLLGASEYCNILTTEAEMAEAVRLRGRHIELTITESAAAMDQADATVTPAAAPGTLTSIEALLQQPAGAEQVEPGSIALMAEELASSIAKNKVVDWESRDAVQARLRNVVRVVLRKYGYPQALRERVAEQVLVLAKLAEGGTSP